MRLAVGQRTDVGRVREGNEDGYFVDDGMGLFAVADGMGGHRAGEVASATALEALVAAVESGRPIAEAIALANDAVLERSAGDERLRGMGTTMTAGTLAAGGRLLVGHVGDSRAYLARDGELRQITEDHSLVEEMVRGGELTPEQAEDHPQRSVITRALGIEPEVEVDVYPVELRGGDRLLLCSDGLTTMVRADDIAAILQREPDPQRAANLLVDAANEAGGEDNVTVVVLDVARDTDGDTAPPPGEQEDAATREEGEEGREAEAAAEPGDARPDRRRANAVGRVLRWALPVVLVLAVAVFTVGWYARRSWYVGLDDGQVAIFRGVPGGLLGWDPTLEERTRIDVADLLPAERSDLEDEKRFSSSGKAEAFVDRLRAEVRDREDARPPPSTTSTTTTSTTTAPPPVAP